MHAMWVMIAVLLILAIAYRYYSAFIAAKVLALDDARPTPAHTLNDGQNYHPTNKWVLFGHHFAAISGAGPLLGPVLAAQFGYLPGLLWILIGVCLAGAVQDFVVLTLSTRMQGRSLAQMARDVLGVIPGSAATIGILFVLVIALAGLGKAVVKALGGDDVVYPAGTEFVAPPPTYAMIATRTIDPKDAHTWAGKVYEIKPGTRVIYPPGADGRRGEATIYNKFELEVKPKDSYAGKAKAAGGGAGGGAGGEADASPAGHAIDVELQPVEGDPTKRFPGWGIRVDENVVAKRKIPGSRWGLFSIALTIPIALFTGWWMYYARKGKVLEASVIGGLLTLGAVWAGAYVEEGGNLAQIGQYFDLSEGGIGWAMAAYGFIASVLPVWVLLCPRDYLSSFLKIGTVGLLVLGVIVANPVLQAPAVNSTFLNGGPTVPGSIFPFLFITVMCGAISGFHALVSSGTTPKMIDKETHARPIGYGAMLIEGLVGIVALIAAASLPQSHYYQMNTAWKDLPRYAQITGEIAREDAKSFRGLGDVEHEVGESLQGRTGGAVTLAVGMAEIFDGAARNVMGIHRPPPAAPAGEVGGPATGPGGGGGAAPGSGKLRTLALEEPSGAEQALATLIKYWYHFAIMFEALFILTTIDTGTRVGRFLLQETLGKWVHPKFAKTDWLPGAVIATAAIVAGWFYFINLSGASFGAIWEMFGIANQMLAVWALAVATVALVQTGKGRYAWVTGLPLCAVTVTTTTAAVARLVTFFGQIGAAKEAADRVNPIISASLIAAILVCTVLILAGMVRKLVGAGKVPAAAAA